MFSIDFIVVVQRYNKHLFYIKFRVSNAFISKSLSSVYRGYKNSFYLISIFHIVFTKYILPGFNDSIKSISFDIDYSWKVWIYFFFKIKYRVCKSQISNFIPCLFWARNERRYLCRVRAWYVCFYCFRNFHIPMHCNLK